MLYDLVIAGGRVIDPSQDVDAVCDVAISNGRIAKVSPRLTEGGAARVVEARGKLVTPGLIDLHCHVYPGLTRFGGAYTPDDAGVLSGVTTVVDAGTTGASTFAGLRDFVLPRVKTRIIPFLHVAPTGLAVLPELRYEDDIQEDMALEVLEAHPKLIGGVKIRFTGPYVRVAGAQAVQRAKNISRQAKRPLMVHIGEQQDRGAPVHTRDMLPYLEAGDILTHFCTGRNGGVMLDAKRPFPELIEAQKRGVVLDIGHGGNNLSFSVARSLLDAGILPFTISTDMAGGNRLKCVFSLTDTMGKFLALGMSLPEVVRRVTVHPARALGLDEEIGTLRPGAAADVSILEIREGHYEFVDSEDESLHGDHAIVPALTVRAGEVVPVDWGPRPTGWLPPTVPSCC